jgi:hypothetical protein
MRAFVLVFLMAVLASCGAPQRFHDYRDFEKSEVREEPLQFSSDPLLDSVYRAQYLEMLRRCGSGRDRCRKGD